MKKSYSILAALLLGLGSCTESYIDEIIKKDPGPDVTAPVVNISFPLDGTKIRVVEDVTAIDINLEVVDDIEIASIQLKLNNAEIASFSDFRDYRRAVKSFRYTNLGNGPHVLEVIAKDLSGKTTSKSVNFEKVEPYRPQFAGEIFYLPFDGDNMELVNIKNPTVSGSPSFVNGLKGKAYAGATNAYLTFPTAGLLGSEFSAAFWYKVNASPDRAGILVVGPPDPNNPNNMNNRRNGFRLFRENAGGKQRIKLNVGTGASDSWFDGGAAADLDPAAGEWVHVAFTISGSSCAVYLNGNVVSQGNFAGVDWTGCNILTIASGAPRFTEWGHLSDGSLFDELRLFNKALTPAEIQGIIQSDKP